MRLQQHIFLILTFSAFFATCKTRTDTDDVSELRTTDEQVSDAEKTIHKVLYESGARFGADSFPFKGKATIKSTKNINVKRLTCSLSTTPNCSIMEGSKTDEHSQRIKPITYDVKGDDAVKLVKALRMRFPAQKVFEKKDFVHQGFRCGNQVSTDGRNESFIRVLCNDKAYDEDKNAKQLWTLLEQLGVTSTQDRTGWWTEKHSGIYDVENQRISKLKCTKNADLVKVECSLTDGMSTKKIDFDGDRAKKFLQLVLNDSYGENLYEKTKIVDSDGFFCSRAKIRNPSRLNNVDPEFICMYDWTIDDVLNYRDNS